jgi:hypothetical protein
VPGHLTAALATWRPVVESLLDRPVQVGHGSKPRSSEPGGRVPHSGAPRSP